MTGAVWGVFGLVGKYQWFKGEFRKNCHAAAFWNGYKIWTGTWVACVDGKPTENVCNYMSKN